MIISLFIFVQKGIIIRLIYQESPVKNIKNIMNRKVHFPIKKNELTYLICNDALIQFNGLISSSWSGRIYNSKFGYHFSYETVKITCDECKSRINIK